MMWTGSIWLMIDARGEPL